MRCISLPSTPTGAILVAGCFQNEQTAVRRASTPRSAGFELCRTRAIQEQEERS
jgi:hypothetical protein